MAIDTACSSSLVALHLAAESVRSGEAPLAIACGVNLLLSFDGHDVLDQLGALSATQRCAPFDNEADGYVRSEGCVAVVLKPLEQATKDQDQILAVIKGSSINHDGKSNGLTAPNGLSQTSCLQDALRRASLSPDTIDYVEAHGTGTLLGDPIELKAIHRAYCVDRVQARPPLCRGSKGPYWAH